MLAIKLQTGQEFQWHVGTPLTLLGQDILRIEYIQASEDELKHIVEQFSFMYNGSVTCSIPIHNLYDGKQTVTWYGDIAKTIIANL